ncbi:MAG: glutamate--tRNA ligase [Alphaproteobacteria bacterium]|nr:glutamate--tRNA ligase [Alphaproteobacteria bacterium]
MRVRFAPSPTGLLHVGNARTALINFLAARKLQGSFVLRIDDTDRERSKLEYEEAILEDLEWLGIGHHLMVRQTERVDRHRAAAELLKGKGLLYPAYETTEELERRRKRALALKQPPVYDRAALRLSSEERTALEAQGRRPHWRFRLSQTKVRWHDLVRGEVEIDTAHLSDPVLIRADGSFLYTLPSVVDDIELAVTHIIRGEDHVTNTAVQIEIFAALAEQLPMFAHFPLLVGVGGEALSKRLGSLSLRQMREEGVEAQALFAYLARIGTSEPVALAGAEELAAGFDFAKIGRAPAHFDPAELAGLSARLLHGLDYEMVRARLAALGVGGGRAFWQAVQPNLTRMSDVVDLWRLVEGPIVPCIEDGELAQMAAALLPAEPFDDDTWSQWTGALAARSGRKGRELFRPLRLALTGLEHGPELKKLLPLIGRDKVLARLEGKSV